MSSRAPGFGRADSGTKSWSPSALGAGTRATGTPVGGSPAMSGADGSSPRHEARWARALFRVAYDWGVASDDWSARAERADGPSPGLGAGAHEDCRVRHVVTAGHLTVGDHEVRALARAGDSGGSAGVRANAGHRALRGVPGLGNWVMAKLALGHDEHALPPFYALLAVVEVGVAGHEELV